MSGPLVGSARVEIVGDVGKFATETESQIKRGMGQAGAAVDASGKSMENSMTKHGQSAGANMTRGMADGVTGSRGQLESAGRTVGDGAGRASGDSYSKGAGTAIGHGVSGLKGKVKEQFGDLAKMAVGVFAVDKVGEFFKSSMEKAREAQKVTAQTGAVIKSTGGAAGLTSGQFDELGKKISDYAGIDHTAIQQGENLLATFTKIHDGAGKNNDIFTQATKIMTDMSVAMHKGPAGSAIQLGKALNDPVKGMTALAKVGVQFTAQQKAVNKALVEGGVVNALNAQGYGVTSKQLETMAKKYKGDVIPVIKEFTDHMTAGERKQFEYLQQGGHTVDAQKNILKELTKEFGGSAAAQATAADKASVAWGDFKESVGTAVMPVLDKFWQFMNGHVIPVLQAVLGWIVKNANTIKTLAIVLSPLLVAWGTYAAVTKTVAIAQGILNAVMEANPITLVIMAIAALVAIFVLAWQHSETFRNIVKGAFHGIQVAGEAVWHVLKMAWEKVGKPLFELIVKLVRGYVHVYVMIIRGIIDAFVAVWDGVRTAWDWAYRHIFRPIGQAFNTMVGWIGDAKDAVDEIFSGFFNGLYNAAAWVFNKVAELWNSTVGKVHFHIPGWVPFVGGDEFGFPQMPTISYRERGGPVPRGMTIFGESGPEALFNDGQRQYVLDSASTRHAFPNAGRGQGGLSHEDRELLLAIASRPVSATVMLPDKRVIAKTATEGDMLRDRAR